MWTQRDWKKTPDESGKNTKPEPQRTFDGRLTGFACPVCKYSGPNTEWHGEKDGEPIDLCPQCKTEEEPLSSVKCTCGQWAPFKKTVGNEEQFVWIYECKCGEQWSD